MTAIGLVLVVAGAALIWGGITDRPILKEVAASFKRPTPAAAPAAPAPAGSKVPTKKA